MVTSKKQLTVSTNQASTKLNFRTTILHNMNRHVCLLELKEHIHEINLLVRHLNKYKELDYNNLMNQKITKGPLCSLFDVNRMGYTGLGHLIIPKFYLSQLVKYNLIICDIY